MTYRNLHARSGLAAIAAVLALSSTPLLAQEVTTPPDAVTETPADTPPVADPLAPDPTASEPAAAEEPVTPEPAATPAPATRREATRARTATTSRATAPVRTAAPASPVPASAAPAEAPPVAPPPVAEPVAEPVTTPVAEPVADAGEITAEEAAPIAAGAGFGLLALTGIGLAMRRRRRRDELVHHEANQAYLEEHHADPAPAEPEPAFVRASAPVAAAPAASALPEAEVLADAPKTRLPKDFDLSRFGPHVRAAYMGPTPDNPSLSLKYRLRRAAAMDQRARLEAEKQPVEAPKPVQPQPASKPAWQLYDEGFMLRKAGSSEKRPSRVTQH